MKIKYSLAALLVISSLNATEDLGTISVESSTIDGSGVVNQETESSTINTIDAKLIEKINPKNINELLQTIPGITADVRSTVVEIHMRGIGQQEYMWEDTGVTVVIDGVPLMQNGGKVKFNMDNIESIKVIKGGSSYLYGNSALAGAVIITTKKQKNKNGGSIGVEYGSENFKSIKGSLYQSTDNYAINLNTNYNSTDGYWDLTKSDLKSLNGKAQYYIDDMSDVTLGIDSTRIYEESSGGSVTGMTEALANPKSIGDGNLPRSSEYYTDLDKYFITYNKDFENDSNIKISTYYYQDFYDDVSSAKDIIPDANDFSDTYINDGNEYITQYGVKSEYKATVNSLAYMLGLDIGQRELDTNDEIIFTGTDVDGDDYFAGVYDKTLTEEDNMAIYTELKYQVNQKLTTIFNARIDNDKYNFTSKTHDTSDGTTWTDATTNRSKKFTNDSYRAGITYQLDNDKTLYSNISTGFRNPLVTDMFKGDFDSDYTNNPDLKEQTTTNYEIGLRGSQDLTDNTLNYEITLFQIDTKDIIARNEGTYYSNNADLMMDNVGDAVNRGLELMLKTDRSKQISYNMSYTYLDAYYKSHNPFSVSLGDRGLDEDETYNIIGNKLPRVPHHKLDIIINYKVAPKWDLMTELYAQSSYYADETNFVKMPGYEKVNLKVTYTHNNSLSYFARVDNVLDKQYVRTAFLTSDRDKDDDLDIEDATITVDPGRVFYAGLKYTF